MIMKIYFKVAKILRLKAIIALFFLLGFGGITQAQTDSELIKLVTDKPVYINGETVNLSWYINTAVQNCVITGPDLTLPITPSVITSDLLPVTGVYSYVPPNDSVTSFNLNCGRYTAVVVVPVTPSVTVYIDNQSDNITKYYDEDLGGAPTTNVSWSSTNATRCSDVLYRSVETGNVWTTVVVADDADYVNRRGTSGDQLNLMAIRD